MPENTVNWLTLTPAGPLSLGNLTPVGQNSGQVGCRWPPNGHQLAACLGLPSSAQLWGPFWHSLALPQSFYVPLPLPVYALDEGRDEVTQVFRLREVGGYWQSRPEHEGQPIEVVGGSLLISAVGLRRLWREGTVPGDELVQLPWRTLTLSHNSRHDYQVREEGGFFAEMTTLMEPGWSILVGVLGDYEPPQSNDTARRPPPSPATVALPLKRFAPVQRSTPPPESVRVGFPSPVQSAAMLPDSPRRPTKTGCVNILMLATRRSPDGLPTAFPLPALRPHRAAAVAPTIAPNPFTVAPR